MYNIYCHILCTHLRQQQRVICAAYLVQEPPGDEREVPPGTGAAYFDVVYALFKQNPNQLDPFVCILADIQSVSQSASLSLGREREE